jgi:hypothetical protein
VSKRLRVDVTRRCALDSIVADSRSGVQAFLDVSLLE